MQGCLAATLVACGSDDDGGGSANTPTAVPTSTSTSVPTATPTIEVCAITPGAWSAPQWEANAAEALALRAQLDELVGANAMRGAEQGTVVIGSTSQLVDLYRAGDPSLADVTTAGYDAVMSQVFDDFVALVAAGPGDPINGAGLWVPGPDGGIFGESDRGINAGGLEIRQLADKGLFSGGALFNYALGLSEGSLDAAAIDAMAAAWGANQDLDPAGSLTDAANYSYQMGFHAEIAAALNDAKAYAGDSACSAERDEAVRAFFRTWERSMFARLVYYANRGASLVAGATTNNDRIEGLHQLAEGVGLAVGFTGLPDPTTGPLAGQARVITDAEVDAIMAAVGVDPANLNASTTGTLVEDASDFAAAAIAVEEIVADVYDLDASEIASYRDPVAG
jgi:hypothetical protein